MLIPPSWAVALLSAVLGFANWGFWFLGAGLELAYLFSLA
jgi:hypothetical protein